MPGRRWTEEEVLKLEECCSGGLSASETAKVVGRPGHSVQSKASRMGFQFSSIFHWPHTPLGQSLQYRFYNTKMNAKHNGHVFDLEPSDMLRLWELQDGRCFYTGVRLTLPDSHKRWVPTTASVDRVDNDKGYTKDNVVLCCRDLNMMKRNIPIKDFMNICRCVVVYQSGGGWYESWIANQELA